MKKMRYCKRCVYPMVAVNLHVDHDGICSSCRTFEAFEKIPQEVWDKRKQKFGEILAERLKNNKSNYDVVIGVSGGKDSYYQAHVICKEYGLKPLLVTYHGNNYLPEGDYNRDRMKEVFNADHLVYGPSVEVLKKLNRVAFRRMGDMNWHNHCGIFTVPIQMAVKFNVPFVIWGEVAWDISGMYDPDDYVEFSARVRHEHCLRGYEWYDLINDPKDMVHEKDMIWAKYPSDDEILKAGVRGLYIGNFFPWDPASHTKMMMDLYQWKQSEKPFERTYRMTSNLDDRYENGIHDLLKFIKFGYGRCSDHASKDIRLKFFSREEGLDMVKKYDHVVSSDLQYWLKYVDMTETEFWETADTFRDPRIWWIENGEWWKDNVWGQPSSYGKVHLPKDQWAKYK